MSAAGIKQHLADWRNWELNPIVIKELRQAVRSWAVVAMLVLFLVVLFLTSLWFLVTQSFTVDADIQLGGSMFSAFIVILAMASVFFIPLYVGVRVAMERQENNPDLLYVSTLSPARIIRGKFFCGAYMALLFFSACMPFMAFTNLLRGVDLPTVFLILAFLYLVVCAANMVAIFLACLPVSRPFKFLFVIYGIFQSFGIIASLVGISFNMMRSGMGAMMTGRDFWVNVAMFLALGLAGTGLFYVLAVALVAPPSANRALPVRIYVTAIWVLGGLASFSWTLQSGSPDRLLPWLFVTFVVMLAALLVTISNADELSLRVRRTIPQSFIRRAVAFLFYNGAAGGLLWIAGILAVTYFAVLAGRSLGTKFDFDENWYWFGPTVCYAFAYALLGLLVHRKFLSRRAPKVAGLLAVLLAGGWAVVPSVVLFFLNRLTWTSVQQMQPGNIFNIFTLRDGELRLEHLYCSVALLGLMLVLNFRWFARQVQAFRPPGLTPEPGPVAPVAPPPIPQ